ncbi:hypothetical protein [Carnobacterium sp. ISL-102]|uniref:hypothetical protein n=1 Tax=Carnobacterium sp. ISL-102 TaxID=2819142 RepID=UPI001BE90A82|nr:hypothetical protein [Carnobacterium sp. ISL-102]MBT2732396.1 hypothetical protein [Carnobacterium sp. ISL-102]
MKKETGTLIGILLFIILITAKLWLKATLEIQLLGLVTLIAVSWFLKYEIMKRIKRKIK